MNVSPECFKGLTAYKPMVNGLGDRWVANHYMVERMLCEERPKASGYVLPLLDWGIMTERQKPT